MKTTITILAFLISFGALSQSVTITPSGDTTSNHSYKIYSGNEMMTLSLKNSYHSTGIELWGDYATRGNIIANNSSIRLWHPGEITLQNSNSGGHLVKLHANGNFSVGNIFTPSAGLHVKEYSKLGEDAPAVKMKKLSGTTPPNQGFCTTVPLGGISHEKVLDYKVLVNYSSGSTAYVSDEYSLNPNYRFSTYMSSDGIHVCLHSGNSSNLVSKSFKVLITYEE